MFWNNNKYNASQRKWSASSDKVFVSGVSNRGYDGSTAKNQFCRAVQTARNIIAKDALQFSSGARKMSSAFDSDFPGSNWLPWSECSKCLVTLWLSRFRSKQDSSPNWSQKINRDAEFHGGKSDLLTQTLLWNVFLCSNGHTHQTGWYVWLLSEKYNLDHNPVWGQDKIHCRTGKKKAVLACWIVHQRRNSLMHNVLFLAKAIERIKRDDT